MSGQRNAPQKGTTRGGPRRYGDEHRVAWLRLVRVSGLSHAEAAVTVGASAAWGATLAKQLAADPNELGRLEQLLEVGTTPSREERLLRVVPTHPGKMQLNDQAAEALEDFVKFRLWLFGRPCKPWQLDAFEQIKALYESPDREYMIINVAPGTGKSTLWNDLAAWFTVRDRTIRGGLGHANLERANRYVDRLRKEFDRVKPARPNAADESRGAVNAIATLTQWYGRFQPPRGEVWRRDQFKVLQVGGDETIEKEPTWSAISMEAEPIGDRLNLMILDDATTAKRSKSDLIREDDREQFDNVLENRIEPGGLFVLCGQRIHPLDLFDYCESKVVTLEVPGDDGIAPSKPKYHVIRYPAHFDDMCGGPEMHGNGECWPKSCLLDPSAHPVHPLAQLKSANERNYQLVYQQNGDSYGDALVSRVWIDGGEHPVTKEQHPGCWDHDRALGVFPNPTPPGFSYATVDPSGTQYWAIQWWYYDLASDERILIDKWRRRMKASDLLEGIPGTRQWRGLMEDTQIRSQGAGHPIVAWVIERNGAQRYLLQYECVTQWRRHHRVAIVAHDTHGANKTDPKLGVDGTLPSLYSHGKVRLPGHPNTKREVESFCTELCTYPFGGTTDEVMAQWMGEYNIPNLRARRDRPPLVQWRPSWTKDKPTHSMARNFLARAGGGYNDDDA